MCLQHCCFIAIIHCQAPASLLTAYAMIHTRTQRAKNAQQTDRQTDRLAEHQQTEGQAPTGMQEPDALNSK